MRIAILTFLMCFSLFAGAQINYDSLLQIWQNAQFTPEQRLSALDELARSYTETNPDSALVLAQHQQEFAAQHGHRVFEAKALQIIAQAYDSRNDLEAAITHLESSLILLDTLQDQILIGDVLYKLGVLYDRHGMVEKSLDYLDQCLQVRMATGD